MKEESALGRKKDDSSYKNIFEEKINIQKCAEQSLNAQSFQQDATLNNIDVEVDISLKLNNPQPLSKKNAFEYKTFRKEYLCSGLITSSKRTEIVNPIETRTAHPSDMDKQINTILKNEEQLSIKEEKEKNIIDATHQASKAKNTVDTEINFYRTKTIFDKQNLVKRTPTQRLVEAEKPRTQYIMRKFLTKLRDLTSCKPINQLRAQQYKLLGDKANFYRESHKFQYDENAKV